MLIDRTEKNISLQSIVINNAYASYITNTVTYVGTRALLEARIANLMHIIGSLILHVFFGVPLATLGAVHIVLMLTSTALATKKLFAEKLAMRQGHNAVKLVVEETLKSTLTPFH